MPFNILAAQQAMQASSANKVARFAQGFNGFDPRVAAGALGGMLLLPDFQASTYRLEMLAHVVVSTCKGAKAPRQRDLAHWLTDAGKIVGHHEDPAEDVFAGRVSFEGVNYRVLEGLSEGGCFHLQLILKIVEDMPESFADLKDACRACLILSETLCERAGIAPFELGAEHPARGRITQAMTPPIRTLSKWVTFSAKDLDDLDVPIVVLNRFLLPPAKWDVLPEYAGDSTFFRRPFLQFGEELVVGLPTAIGPAIRTAVIDACRLLGPGAETTLRMQHLSSVGNLLLDTPMVREIGMKPAPLNLGPVVPSEPVEIEPGYWVQVVLANDDLAGFEIDGLMGSARNSHEAAIGLNAAVQAARERCEATPGFRAGLTLAIMCGFGRGQMVGLSDQGDRWFVEGASAYDVEVLGWRSDFSLSDLFRLAITERNLASKGFQVSHVNGLLAQVGDALGNRGHLIHHEALPDGMPGGMIMAPTNGQLRPRIEHHQRFDRRLVTTPDGVPLEVMKDGSGARSPGGVSHIYASIDDLNHGRLRAVWAKGSRKWWIESRPRSDDVTGPSFGAFEALRTWMERIGPVVTEALPELPDVLLWDLRIDPQPPTPAEELIPAGVDEVRASIDVKCNRASAIVTTTVLPNFWRGLSNPDNVAEATLVEAFVRGALRLLGQDETRAVALTEKIIPSPLARQLHAFAPQDFRDHMRDAYQGRVVQVSAIQDGAIRIGLGWSGVDRPGGTVRGIAECTEALNAITAAAEKALCDDLALFDRRSLLEAAVRNHEASAIDARRWKRTAPAIIALSDDKLAVREEIAENLFRQNGVSLACRLLMEIGLHHCPETNGFEVADIDLSRLMARALMIVHLGGYSDAIRYGAMKPEIRISPAGEVQIDVTFFESVMDPVGRDFSDQQVNREQSAYVEYLRTPELPEGPDQDGRSTDFEKAWEDELGASLLSYRCTIDALEDLCIKQGLAWLSLPRKNLIDQLKKEIPDADTVIEQLESVPRDEWKNLPPGFDDSDRQPWRFRRRLSIARRPLVRLGSGEDADILVAPGLVREGLTATVGNMYDGSYDAPRLSSPGMRRWAGKMANERGHAFQEQVATELSRLGWSVGTEVKFGEILGRDPEDDPGDIDVLGWRSDGRVLLLECKQLQLAKTPSEVAKQLANFRGTTNDRGKPDRLAKHLNRWTLARTNSAAFSAFLGITDPSIEAGLVFSNTVPMQFAIDRMSEKLWVGTTADLVAL
ncbi:hypothetical protein ACRARG_12000 [Pseudooceanicola sp. C21-150M6]|uniref:hypothetical protein n=1 Tax=Pseudooceanicola sp. C21-150M6 TaxID=3434355 RepID=UPI003D7F9029